MRWSGAFFWWAVACGAASVVLMGCGGDDFQAEGGIVDAPDAATGDVSPDTESGAAHDAHADVDVQTPEGSDESATPEAGLEACVPGTCESLAKNCGPTPDGCGGTLACGSCPSNQLCGGGGEANVCGGCVPDTCIAHNFKCGTMPERLLAQAPNKPLPEAIITRRKTGFGIPVARWLDEAGMGGDSGSRSWAVELATRQGWQA